MSASLLVKCIKKMQLIKAIRILCYFFVFQCLFCLCYLINASNLLFFLILLAILILFAYNQNIFSKPLMCLTLKRFTEKYKKEGFKNYDKS